MMRSYTDSECDGGVSDSISQESPQDVYNFTFSSQESIRWRSDQPYNLTSSSSSQDNDQLPILPSRNGRPNGGFDGFDDNYWKSTKKLKICDSEPFTLNSSQESDELAILPPQRYKEGKTSGYSNGVHGKLKNSEPYCLNSSQESDDLAFLTMKSGKDNGRVDGFHRKSKKVKENGVLHKKKKKVKSSELGSGVAAVNPTKTLMETQEFGEMMEHMDEVNFALDGLKKDQPVRVRRASLLSLLSVCGTTQQRQLLRAHGLAKTIIDVVLGLSSDDLPSNLAAAALFYILTGDGQDEYLLDSPSCIHFLIKLVKPRTSNTAKPKASTLGSKLLAIRIDADGSQDSTKGSDSSDAAIMLKVQEVLVNCRDLKPRDGNDDGVKRPELNPAWISLLTMEKACLSTMSIEDTGRVRKNRGNFKEKLRELGGLSAVFEVARNCHSTLARWLEQGRSLALDKKNNVSLESLALLLKCMKIMENATFLCDENQRHLLGMKGGFDSERTPRTFIKLILSLIKILSDIYLLQSSPGRYQEEKTCNHSNEMSKGSDFTVNDDEILFIASSSRSSIMEASSSQKRSSICQGGQWLTSGLSRSSKSNSTTTAVDPWLKMRIDSSTSGSCSGTSGNTDGRTTLSNRGSGKIAISNDYKSFDDTKCGLADDSQDPFAFDEDDFEPSKWDLLSGGHKMSRPQNTRAQISDQKNGCQSLLLMGQEDMDKEHYHSSEASCSSILDEEKSNLLADCLLSAVKALMNLTNDNTVGCQQIAACGGLEILSSLVASHFPIFTRYLYAHGNTRENSLLSRSFVEVANQNDVHLTDAELDLLVAILGLLVNLVEKDGPNRSQLAAVSVSLPNLEGFDIGNDTNLIPLLCSIFLANQGAGEATEGLSMDDEDAVLQGEKEAEKMILEAYSALLLAFLSTESQHIRNAIAECLPDHNLSILVPVLERFVEFHLSLDMISPETHTNVLEVIESCRIP